MICQRSNKGHSVRLNWHLNPGAVFRMCPNPPQQVASPASLHPDEAAYQSPPASTAKLPDPSGPGGKGSGAESHLLSLPGTPPHSDAQTLSWGEKPKLQKSPRLLMLKWNPGKTSSKKNPSQLIFSTCEETELAGNSRKAS